MDKKERFAKSGRDVLRNAKESLQHQGQKMLDLAAHISTEKQGRPLKAEEKELVRLAFLDEVKQAAAQAVANYLTGNKAHFETDLEHLETVFSDLEKI